MLFFLVNKLLISSFSLFMFFVQNTVTAPPGHLQRLLGRWALASLYSALAKHMAAFLSHSQMNLSQGSLLSERQRKTSEAM